MGATEAASISTRRLEAVHESLFRKLTVEIREPLKIGLLLVFAAIIHVWLAIVFVLFCVLASFVGRRVAGNFRLLALGRPLHGGSHQRGAVIEERIQDLAAHLAGDRSLQWRSRKQSAHAHPSRLFVPAL